VAPLSLSLRSARANPSPGAVSARTCTPLLLGKFNNIEFLIHFGVSFEVRKETSVIRCALLSEGYSFSYLLRILIV